ncbi:MAG TPA: DUF6390 family protein [Mycobacteriales bacterium]|nr:DUF6390 family protein [Mycobacteriales bacterium]
MSAPAVIDDGPQVFAAFAYPPNALGYCGPDDAAALLEQRGAAGETAALRSAAARFEGAWPYLRLIAAANAIADPLDRRVVEAYWIGNALLERVDARMLGPSLEERFRRRAGRAWERLVAPVPEGARPHHNFHVFGVYPWVGLIRSGVVDEPLRVIDRCRIRWGRVEAIIDDLALVRTRPLVWNGRKLALGPAAVEQARLRRGGASLAPDLLPGDWCAMHWDWVCARLSPSQVSQLRRWTGRTLAVCQQLPG